MAELISPLSKVSTRGQFGRPDEIGEAGVVLSNRICFSLVQVSAWPDTFDAIAEKVEEITGLAVTAGNHSPSSDRHAIMPIAPGRMLVESDGPAVAEQFSKNISSGIGAVTDLSHGRVVIRISGHKAEWVLSKGIAADFSVSAFPLCTSIASGHHDTGLTIRRVDEKTFDLFVFTSLARDFWHWLEMAAAEVGYDVV